MGGKTAMKFALEHPEMVSELIVVDMSPRDYTVHHDHIMEALKLVDFNVVKSRKEAENILMKELNDRGVVQFLSKNIYWKEKDRLDFRFNLDALYNNLDLISGWNQTYSQFEGKTLFIRGGKAKYISNDEPNIPAYFPNSRIVTIDSGHWVHAEKPDDFFKLITEFLE